MNIKYLIFLSICLLNPSLTNIGMGLQKLAIDRMPRAGGSARKRNLALLWVLGLVCQVAVVLLAAKALTIGNASTLGGFAGFGLVVLALFCHFVLKEEMLKQDY